MSETDLLFKAGDEKYLIDSSYVSEIVRNQYVVKIPFLPDYIKGVINCFGNLYAAVDFSMLMGGGASKDSSFMILKSDEEIALQISSASDFYDFDSLKEKFKKSETKSGFYRGTVSFKDGKQESPAFLLNMETIIKKIKSDLQKDSFV